MAWDIWYLMPFAFLIIGLMLVVIGARNQTAQAATLLQSEFTGSNSFIQWFLAIMILGAIGYYRPLKPVADGLLGLVILAMVLARGNPNAPGGGLFAQLEADIQGARAINAPATNTATLASSNTNGAVQSSSPMNFENLFAQPAYTGPLPNAVTI